MGESYILLARWRTWEEVLEAPFGAPSRIWASARAFKASKRDRIGLIEPGPPPSVAVMNNPG